MPAAIRDFCQGTGQAPPEGVAATARCVLDSLALSYRHALEQFSRVLGHSFTTLRIVGGGSQNELLCRLASDATGLFTTAGPVEATVVGNLLVQAKSKGYLTSTEEIREVVRSSFELEEYEPRPNPALEEQYGKYVELVG
jgi:rhamnulokinase